MKSKFSIPSFFLGGTFLALLLGFVLYWTKSASLTSRFDAPAIVQGVEKLNQLATVKYTVQRVIALTQQKDPLGLGEESILVMVQGDVSAGVNLTRLSADDVIPGPGQSVTIRLPSPQILNVYLDEKQTRVWDHRVTWWTPWVPYDPDLEHKARLRALDDIRAAALKQGILNDAGRNAQTAIGDFLKALGLTAKFTGAT